MPILKRYKDGSYIPLSNPLVRRMDYGKPESKKARVKRQLKEGTYKKNWFDRYVVDSIIPKR